MSPHALRTIVAAAALVGLAACGTTLTSVPTDQAFELSPGETVLVAGTGARVTFVNVPADTRCPTTAICVTAGNAEVAVRIRGQLDADTTIVLNTTLDPKATDVNGLHVALEGLEPYPDVSRLAGAQYRAHLIVRLVAMPSGL